MKHDLFDKTKKLSNGHLRELAGFCAAIALLLVAAAVISSGGFSNNLFASNQVSSGSQTACGLFENCDLPVFVLTFKANPNPVVPPGGYTTISWTTYDADDCFLSGPTLPEKNAALIAWLENKGMSSTSPYIVSLASNHSITVGSSGTYYTGPVTGTSLYKMQCVNNGPSDSGTSAVYSLTVNVATPGSTTTLASFTANPTMVVYNGTSTLSWSGYKGTAFSSCELTGGQFTVRRTKSGTFFTTFPGSVQAAPITATTTYSMDCFDSNGASTGWQNATVGVIPPPKDVCNNMPGLQTTPPANSKLVTLPVGSICTCNSGYKLSGSSCVATAKPPLCANGLADSYAPSCMCPGSQVQSGSICVAAPVSTCSNGLANSYAPSCTCASGQVQKGSSCVLKGVINSLVVTPSRVLKGNTATVSWSTVGMTLCSLTGLTNAGTSALSSLLSSSVTTQAITGKTIYTLTCSDLSGASYSSSVTLNLIPQTIEQ